jgi:hypothetical protein
MSDTDSGRKYWNFSHTVEDFKEIAESSTLIVADVETTGLDPLRPGVQIVEVAAAAYNLKDGIEEMTDLDLKSIGLYHTYIDLNEPAYFWQFLEDTGKVTVREEKPNKTKEMTMGEVLVMNRYLTTPQVEVVPLIEGLMGLKDFIEGYSNVTLCGHNLRFDLNQICRVVGPIRHTTTLDTMDIAWHYLIPLIDAADKKYIKTCAPGSWYFQEYPDYRYDPSHFMSLILRRKDEPNGWPIGKGMITCCKLNKLGIAFSVPNTAAHSGRADVEQTAGIFCRMVHYLNMNAESFSHPAVIQKKKDLASHWRTRWGKDEFIAERHYRLKSRATKNREYEKFYDDPRHMDEFRDYLEMRARSGKPGAGSLQTAAS